MPKIGRLARALNEIVLAFSNEPHRVYSKTQVADLLIRNRRTWRLGESTSIGNFILFLLKNGVLREHTFRSPAYKQKITRYSWGEASQLELALSLKPRAYLCHETALMLHGLAKFNQKTIYLNVEQSVKLNGTGSLTQEAIKRAFSGKQRKSNLIFTSERTSVVIVAGKNTSRLGVEEIAGPASETLQATNLERTLIDIAVRPAYAGGIAQVRKAYRTAKGRMLVDRLLTILNKLDYAYPYHQAIGFLMHNTGYPEESCAKLRALGLEYDFYLAHEMEEPQYSENWRVFYPRKFR
ncbi:hypothetical protein RA307_02440 [Xanthobacteraceae bacterium Astr-EGSB]|uniref:hypothetical protein n=1 Tax=Astrobacterium formosum TaxID=3069710 RepID=UPI0027B0FDE6|nr:hypothetical protein [Xanthobacteraceae bacterium Astr-EGSB]